MTRGITLFLTLALAAVARAETLVEADLGDGATPYGFRLPLPAGYRLSAGIAVNGNRVTVNALANGTGTVTINRITLSEGGISDDGHIGFKDLAPYAGLGYTTLLGRGVKLNWDAGALFGALPMLPRTQFPGLPDNLALQNEYLESRGRTVPVAPLAEVTLSLRF